MAALDDTNAPFVRVVVLNWNAAWLTTRCLTALAATDYPSDSFEVVVVDNASIDGSRERLVHDFPDLRLVINPENLGFAEGCNRAMRDLDGVDFVGLVNNDAVVEPGWLRPLVTAAMGSPRVGAVCPLILLETPFRDIVLEPLGDGVTPPSIERVVVDGIDVTGRCLLDDLAVRPDPDRPLDLVREVRRRSELRIPVAAEPRRARPAHLELSVRGAGPGLVVDTGHETARVAGDGLVTVGVTMPTGGVRRVNSLGTDLTPPTEGVEGIEIGFGSLASEARTDVHEVPGFSGGGVLLRAEMLSEVGVFDPAFFAYYEDTDLAWRARRRGWRTLCVPSSVIHHLHGATAGSTARPFYFLNYRNWLSTTTRNGTVSERWSARRHSVHMAWAPFRRNVFGRARRGRRPDVANTALWLRIWLASIAAWPAVWVGRRRAVGVASTDRVRSGLMPPSSPRPPAPRPGGPRLVYIDVTETLRSGWRAGIQRVTCELVRHIPSQRPDIELVPVVWNRLHGRFRRVTAAEYATLLSPTQRQRPHGPPPPLPRWRRAAGRVGRTAGLAPLAARTRLRRERRAEPELHRTLLLDRLAAGSVFLDVDAAWNTLTCRRTELLPALHRAGVSIVHVLCDILPVTDLEWFEQNSARRFINHVEAHAANADLVIAISEDTAAQYRRWGAETGRRIPPVEVVTLGTELPIDMDGAEEAPLPPALQDATYALCVGTIEPRKNHTLLFAAYDDLHHDHPELHLVVVGREGWKATDIVDRLRRHASTDDHVHWFHEATDAELVALYRQAFVVVTPSLSEGFGLPVAEAMGHGCPVLSSNGGALPEAGGDLVEYFDPRRPDELSRLLRRHLEDEAHHEEQRRRVLAVQPKQWSTVALEVGAALGALDAPVE